MASNPTVPLVKPIGEHLRGGHPWAFRDALDLPDGLTSGSVVDLVDADGRFVARGLYDADSPLAVRVWTLDPERDVDQALITHRVSEAWQLRQNVVDIRDTDCYRLINGEGDQMPAVVADRYGDTAVILLDSAAAGRLVPLVSAALLEVVPDLARIIVKDRVRGGGPARLRVMAGGPPEEPMIVREHGLRFEVDVARGHKSGLYLDQRENRRSLVDHCSGLRVLNCFSYTGGFSVAAALGGAHEVTSVDISSPALKAARRNFGHNGLSPGDDGYAFLTADVGPWLERNRGPWDVIVLDPPSMAPSRKAKGRALAQYRELNALALRRLRKGGHLWTFSCSSHVSAGDLGRAVRRAAGDIGRRIEVHEWLRAAPDHPVRESFSEGDYLHGMVVELLGGYASLT